MSKKPQTLPFIQMLEQVLDATEMRQKHFAKAIGISQSYMCDLMKGKRGPSPNLVNKICDYMGTGPKGRRVWHMAAARTDGWEI